MSSQRSPLDDPASKRRKLDNDDGEARRNVERESRQTARRPAFNPALLSSAFYSGPTAYGGAGAAASPARGPYARSQFYNRRRTDVRPAAGLPESSMSQTSRRILDLLEQYSSPISDARRVPVHAPLHCAPLQSSPLPSTVPLSPALAPAASDVRARRFRELQVPSLAVLMRMKRGSGAHAAIAASMSSSLPTYGSPAPFRPKMRARPGRREAREAAQPAMPAPDLPPVTLPGVDLTTFTLDGFQPSSTPAVPRFEFTSPVRIREFETPRAAKRFHFSDPLNVADYRALSARLDTDETVKSNKIVKKSIDNPKTKDHVKMPEIVENDCDFSKQTEKSDHNSAKKKGPETWNGNHNWSEKSELPKVNGGFKLTNDKEEDLKLNDKMFSKDSTAKKTSLLPPLSASLVDIMKKQQQQWECGSCMTRNDQSLLKCICCETLKPGFEPAPAPVKAASSYSGMANFIKKQQQQWECSCCMTGNDQNRNKCACCEAPKPGCEPAPAESAKFNFGSTTNKFKFGIDKADEPVESSTIVNNSETDGVKKPEPSLPITGGFVFGNTVKSTSNIAEAPKEGFTFGIINGKSANDSSESKQNTLPSNLESSFEIKPAGSVAPITNPGGFVFGKSLVDPKPVESAEPEAKKKTFGVPSFLGKDDGEKPMMTFGIQPVISKPVEISPVSLAGGLAVPTPAVATTVAVSTEKISSPPYTFSFGNSAQSPLKPAAPTANASFGSSGGFQFGSPISAPSSTTLPVFKSPGTFNFGTKSVIAPATAPEAKPEENLQAKPLFQLPTPGAGSLFSSPTQTQVAPAAVSKEGGPEKGLASGIQFSAPSIVAEKPKESPAGSSLFNFSSPSSNAGSSIFKPPVGAPVFNFGTTAVLKSDSTTVPIFGSPAAKSQPVNLFGPKPGTEMSSVPGDSLFKTAPATVAPSFTPATPNIFGSAPNTNSSLPGASVFGSNILNPSPSKPTVTVFGSQMGATSSNSPFSAGTPAFGSTGMFGAGNVASPPASSLFGNNPLKPSEGGFMNSQAVASPVFGAPTPTAAPLVNSNMFGSNSAPTGPVFGASFGEAPTPGTTFNFGSSAPNPAFGGPGAAPGVFSFGGSGVAPQPGNAQFNFSMGAPSSAFPAAPGATPGPTQRRIKKAVRRNVLR